MCLCWVLAPQFPPCLATPAVLAPAWQGLARPWAPMEPQKRGVVKESRGTGTPLCCMLALPVLPVPLVQSVMPARGPRGPSGEVLGKVGGDERPAGAAASLSSCQMSLKGWKNRLGRAWKGQAPGGTSAIPGEIQKMHMLGKPWAPLPAPHPAPPPALVPGVGGPGT